MSWLWWGLAAWIATDLAAASWWARHRSREKRAEEIQDRLREIGRRHREAQVHRDVATVREARQRITHTARIPHQTRRTEEDQ
ncbi:hypothetical protein ACODT3_10590 [Streptomyces sp. 4.24]|uniref:hypothetical protein n=1 Tax=Streptomyces tritrimontium TaxID=3406573 RepID=UPI003BB5F535